MGFIALLVLPVKAYADTCHEPLLLHKTLYQNGFLLIIYMSDWRGFAISIYSGRGGYVMTAETDSIACVLSEGASFFPKERKI